LDGLAVRQTGGPSRHTNSPHPSSREGHLSTAGWISSFLLLGLVLNDSHAAVAVCSRAHRNSVPSIQMRCIITANRRTRATIAFFIPRRLAICMALSQHHFLNASCSELLRRASSALSHRHSAIFRRSNRLRPIDIWSTSRVLADAVPLSTCSLPLCWCAKFCSELNSAFRVFLICLTENPWRASPMAAQRQQFPIVC
jgi:hypothetical protein